MRLVERMGRWQLQRRLRALQAWRAAPEKAQAKVFQYLIHAAKSTVWGKQYGFAEIKTLEQFQLRLPVVTYEELYPAIARMLQGEPDVLWPGRVRWFAKSSGTTNARSKYIPMTQESLHECHFAAGKDMVALYLHSRPDSKLFQGKTLSIGGSHEIHVDGQARTGDLSALLIQHMPRYYEHFRSPSKKVALMGEWEAKLAAMVKETSQQPISALAGVPTWTLVLLQQLQQQGKGASIAQLWPELEVFFHGGVSFAPYQDQFKHLLPPQVQYREIYNASEGFFALQEAERQEGMLLLLAHGIFYEFIPTEELDKPNPTVYPLGGVQLGKAYALVISTSGGLWRYQVGDTVRFTSLAPYRIVVQGRTKQYINAFGEELVMENAEAAIAAALAATGATLTDYTAAPIYFNQQHNGGHQWLLEFTDAPNSLELFGQVLDETLRRLNSDYDAKRTKDIALAPPVLTLLPPGSFHSWLKAQGKLGGQHKVPRLANNREYLESILKLTASL